MPGIRQGDGIVDQVEQARQPGSAGNENIGTSNLPSTQTFFPISSETTLPTLWATYSARMASSTSLQWAK
jgi:hypothetical protein